MYTTTKQTLYILLKIGVGCCCFDSSGDRLIMLRPQFHKLSKQYARHQYRGFSVMSDAELRNFRHSINKWVLKEIIPNINKWEDAGILPRYLYKQAAELGILAPGYPVEVFPKAHFARCCHH